MLDERKPDPKQVRLWELCQLQRAGCAGSEDLLGADGPGGVKFDTTDPIVRPGKSPCSFRTGVEVGDQVGRGVTARVSPFSGVNCLRPLRYVEKLVELVARTAAA